MPKASEMKLIASGSKIPTTLSLASSVTLSLDTSLFGIFYPFISPVNHRQNDAIYARAMVNRKEWLPFSRKSGVHRLPECCGPHPEL
jgi:hypothetical protein